MIERINNSTLQNASEVSQIVLYRPDETISIEVRLDAEHDTVWLSQAQMADLYGTLRQAITKHIKNIYNSYELQREETCSVLELVQKEGKRMVRRNVEFYNLDVIISVGYRVNTRQGIQFRQWANRVLRNYLLRGYSINRQLVAMQERIDSRFSKLEDRVSKMKNKSISLSELMVLQLKAFFMRGK